MSYYDLDRRVEERLKNYILTEPEAKADGVNVALAVFPTMIEGTKLDSVIIEGRVQFTYTFKDEVLTGKVIENPTWMNMLEFANRVANRFRLGHDLPVGEPILLEGFSMDEVSFFKRYTVKFYL